MVGAEQWAEIRRMHFVAGFSIKEIVRRAGRDRNTVRRALRSQEPPRYERRPRPSKLDPFREEIHRLLGEDGELPGQVIRERLQELGHAGGKTILDDYLARSGRSSRRRGRSSAPSTGPARSASSICGSPATRSRWGRSSTVVAGSWSPVWVTRARVPAR